MEKQKREPHNKRQQVKAQKEESNNRGKRRAKYHD
jgi:hypothetical protein